MAYLIFLLLALLFASLIWTPSARATQTSITPIADSYVSSLSPDTNYGGGSTVFSYNYQNEFVTPQYYNTWLKFDLSGIPSEATINSIILRLRTFVVVATNKVGVFLSDDTSWKEMEITWNSQPSLSNGQSLQILDIASSNTNYDFNLTTALKGKSIVSLVLKTLQPTGLIQFAQFYSREGAHGPRLIVNYTMPSIPSQADPTTTIFVLVAIVVVLVAAALFLLRRRRRVDKQPPTTPQLPTPP